MRTLFALIAACMLAAASPAWAQAETALRQATSEYAPSHVAAARDALQAMWVDNGAVAQASLWAVAAMTPRLLEGFASTAWYAGLAPERREALNTYIGNLGPVVQEESLRAVPQALDSCAPRLAAILTEAELADVIAFARSPEGGEYLLSAVVNGARGAAFGHPHELPPPREQAAALERFERTAGGAAFLAHATELGVVFHDFGASVTGAPKCAGPAGA